MKNIPVGDIKPKDDEDNVQVIDPPSSSSVGAGPTGYPARKGDLV